MVYFDQETSQVQLRLLGPPSLYLGRSGQTVQLPSKAYALIALLILEFHGNARRGILCARLWENTSEIASRNNLRQLLTRIRRVESLAKVRLLVIDNYTISYNSTCLPTDINELLRIIDINTIQNLCHTFSLHRGKFLHGVTLTGIELESWVQASRNRIDEHFLNLGIKAAQTIGGPDGERALRCLMVDFPLDDRICRALMQYLVTNDDSNGALLVYRRFHHTLATEIALTPEPDTITLFNDLLQNNRHEDIPVSSLASTTQPPRVLEYGQASAILTSPLAVPILKNGDVSAIPRLTLLKPIINGSRISVRHINFVTSFIEDVTLHLCRLRSIAIIAPYSAWQMSNPDGLLQAQEFGINYVIQFRIKVPSTQSTHTKVKMSLQFIHTSSMEILWTEEFMLAPDDLADHFHELATKISKTLADQIDYAEITTYRRTGIATAYTHYLLGREHLRTLNLPNLRRARKSFRAAVEISNHFAPALSSIARTMVLEWILLAREDKELLFEAQSVASRAVVADPFDGGGHRELGRSSLFLGKLDEAFHHGKLAEQYAPHHADVLADLADTFTHGSEMAEAKKRMDLAMDLNPLPPDEYRWTIGGIDFFLGNYNHAFFQLQKMHDCEPAFRLMAACAAMSGEQKLAEKYRRLALANHPNFLINEWVARLPVRDDIHREHYVTALKAAGFQ